MSDEYSRVKKIRGLNRVVDADSGKLLRSHLGNPLDGGGHKSAAKATRQCAHINESMSDRKKK